MDAGAKTLTKDRAPFLAGYGLIRGYPDAVIERLSDYHGAVRIPAGTPAPHLGEVVAIVPNHVCPVVDLFDSFLAVRGADGRSARGPSMRAGAAADLELNVPARTGLIVARSRQTA